MFKVYLISKHIALKKSIALLEWNEHIEIR